MSMRRKHGIKHYHHFLYNTSHGISMLGVNADFQLSSSAWLRHKDDFDFTTLDFQKLTLDQ